MSSADEVVDLQGLSIQEECKMEGTCTAAPEDINQVAAETNNTNNTNHHGFCAICLNKIVLAETALVKGCEHAYCIHDYMFEESVCLLLRASWFKPLIVVEREEVYEETEDYYCEDEDEDFFLGSSSSLRIGNRRWGDNGYVRGGRQEARPISRPNFQDSGAGPSRQPKKKEAAAAAAAKEPVGRRAKRTLKREAADMAAAAKHQQHLVRFGRT
ncbi:uncharacterized protein LOC111411649 isoform X2 [Olea europaea var. sylvestris]|uniref:uncharacterized protein LOC111411649 isoform X2 n=1 Tax=Olea europaea var. sylvestris TaxID=158386 RepID=UPI000C1D0E10|nr:uncharacterized protein LOC111411649 isoform X2 [Olea europaea var. sylvestris]